MNKSFTEQRHWIAGGLLLLFTGLSLSGCKTAHMALPESLQSDASELTVEGRKRGFNESFQFGSYRAVNVHRGWTRGDSVSIAGFSDSKAKQKYEFSIEELDRSTWDVQCATGVKWSNVDLKGGFLGKGLSIERSPDRNLACSFKQEGSEEHSTLVMTQSNSESFLQGAMTYDATQINISATNKMAGSPFPLKDATGYMFHIEGRLIGAVEVFTKGTVWLDDTATPEIRSVLAATASALLLYQDIKSSGR